MKSGIYPSKYVQDVNTASSFAVQLINTAMEKYHVSFRQVDTAMEQVGLWDRMNDRETAILMAHDYLEDYLWEIENYLKRSCQK